MQILSIPENEEIERFEIAAGEHIIGKFVGDDNGPSLVVFGSIHGNEHSGALAMERMIQKLKSVENHLKGRVYLIAGNTRALQKNVRFVDADLNRHWTTENIKRNSPGSHISTNRIEDKEQKELLEIVDEIVSTAREEVYALDLHSTSAESAPFAMIGDTLRNRRFARKFPAIILLGIEEQLDSTILEYVNNLGAVTLGFEAGQHTTKAAVDNQEALIWLALLNSGILEEGQISRAKYEGILTDAMGTQRIIEIRHRHGIKPSDEFRMELGFENFQPVRKGEILASDLHGLVKAVETGLVLMPLYQSQGDDGFFLGREISSFWLWLSRILRKLKLGNLMAFLPGVARHPEDEDEFIVNTGVARVFPLQIFHLLGFRKRRWRNEKLIVSRRKHDTVSPFTKKNEVD
jgi:succinylglutamate desuccinylase